MNDYQIVLPLVTRRQSLKIKLFVYAGLLFLAIGLFNVFFGTDLLKIIFLMAGAFTIWIGGMFKDYDLTGSVKMTESEIVVDGLDGLMSYNLQDMKEMEICLMGIKGEFFSPKAIAIKQGGDNFLMFNYQGEKKMIYFLLEEDLISPLRSILEIWRKNNFNFKLHNQTWKSFSSKK